MSDNIKSIIEEMRMVYKNDKRPWIIGYSGGKDSTTVVQLVYQMLLELPEKERHKKVYLVSSDTLVENPIILMHLKESSRIINKSAKKHKLPLESVIVHPEIDDTFWTNIIGKGFPTPKSSRFRWCTERLKISPSNKFIKEKVEENGEVIVLLGVRKAESAARRQSIEKREIEGYLLNPHATLNNTYVYSPIVELTANEVWKVLLSNGGISPWGGDNNKLFALYSDGDGGECPFILTTNQNKEIETPSCGNTRFGCWTCTVVQKDRSLTGFIESGEEWLIPLAEFREWLLEIRDERRYRDKKQRSGRIYRLKVMKDRLSPEEVEVYLNEGYEVRVDEKGREFFWVKGLGPFNYEARELILRKLLEAEEEVGIELITIEELKAIEAIWNKEFDIRRDRLCKVYEEVKERKLPWAKFVKPIFEDEVIEGIEHIAKEYDIEPDLLNKLLILTEQHKNYSNKTQYRKEMDKLLNQEWLHSDIYDEEYIDEN
ncbi:MAG: DNA phosphorothioation system sulfurtransferase DndC [Caldicoprobacterales bacterium]|jgi:DNA sulfur modification protein DndC